MSNKFFGGVADTIYRKCDKCAEEEQVQRKSSGTIPTPASPTPTFLNNLNHSGRALSRGEQQFFGERMNHDFTDVKIHTEKQAAKSAALTSKSTIVNVWRYPGRFQNKMQT